MNDRKLHRSDVEKSTKEDKLYEAVQIGLQAVSSLLPEPVLQASVSCTLAFLFSCLGNPMEKRRNEWIEQIDQALAILESKFSDLEQRISNNENVLSVIIAASQMAMKTYNKNKLKALQNIIVNTIIHPNYEEYKIQMFLSMVDGFTEWHIRILDYFSRPEEFQKKYNIVLNFDWMGNQPAMQIFWKVYPQMQEQKDYIKVIMNDLCSNGLLSVDGKFINVVCDCKSPLGLYAKECGPLAKRTTKFGDELLKFITEWED